MRESSQVCIGLITAQVPFSSVFTSIFVLVPQRRHLILNPLQAATGGSITAECVFSPFV